MLKDKTKINYTLLAITLLTSYLGIFTFEFYPGAPYNKSLDELRIFSPGILSSFFILFIQRANKTFWQLILFYLILLAIYFAAIIAGLSSWGIGVPFAGGIGAVLIRKLFFQKAKLLDNIGIKYLTYGFISSAIGLILFYSLIDYCRDGEKFAFILILWQSVFGVLWINHSE